MSEMDTSCDADQENSLKFIRKLRKKLRQIERLEKGQRELTDEEKIKLSCKHNIREKLQLILSTINEANISFESTKSESEEGIQEQHEENKENKQSSSSGVATYNISYNERPMDFISSTQHEMKRNKNVTDDTKTNFSEGADIGDTPVKSFDNKLEKGKKVQNLRSRLRRHWRNSSFQIIELQGHNDTVCALDAIDNWIVSGSRDTTLKLWDVTDGTELRSMGGHTGQVTAVLVLSTKWTDDLRNEMDPRTVEAFTDIKEKESLEEKFVISGSTDCSVRLWLLPRGICIKSLYNYNPVSAISYAAEKNYLFVGSSSGNLTVYNMCTNEQIYSSTIHKSQITRLQCSENRLYSSSSTGCISVWKIESENTKKPKLENVQFNNLQFEVSSEKFDLTIEHSFEDHGSFLEDRQIHDFLLYKNSLYYGDDGVNIKSWNPATGETLKLRNHKPNVPGITDSLAVIDDILLSSSYDMDTGTGSINVRSLSNECFGAYLASFCHHDVPRLIALTVMFSENLHCLVTGGEKLLLWKFLEPGSKSSTDDAEIIKGENIADLTKPASDSDVPSEGESSGAEDDGKWFWQWKSSKTEKTPQKSTRNESDSEDTDSLESSAWKGDGSSLDKSSHSYWDWCGLL